MICVHDKCWPAAYTYDELLNDNMSPGEWKIWTDANDENIIYALTRFILSDCCIFLIEFETHTLYFGLEIKEGWDLIYARLENII